MATHGLAKTGARLQCYTAMGNNSRVLIPAVAGKLLEVEPLFGRSLSPQRLFGWGSGPTRKLKCARRDALGSHLQRVRTLHSTRAMSGSITLRRITLPRATVPDWSQPDERQMNGDFVKELATPPV